MYNQDTPAAFTVRVFCEKLQISPSHFYVLLKLNRLRVIRLGRKVLVPSSELVRLLSEGA